MVAWIWCGEQGWRIAEQRKEAKNDERQKLEKYASILRLLWCRASPCSGSGSGSSTLSVEVRSSARPAKREGGAAKARLEASTSKEHVEEILWVNLVCVHAA